MIAGETNNPSGSNTPAALINAMIISLGFTVW